MVELPVVAASAASVAVAGCCAVKRVAVAACFAVECVAVCFAVERVAVAACFAVERVCGSAAELVHAAE